MFLSTAKEIAKKYPHIEFEAMIVDNTCMQMASRPEQFDVLVTPNLYGNLVTNIACGALWGGVGWSRPPLRSKRLLATQSSTPDPSGLVGGVALAPGANLGGAAAIFEQGARAVSKDIAGQGIANPTALLFSSVLMVRPSHCRCSVHQSPRLLPPRCATETRAPNP